MAGEFAEDACLGSLQSKAAPAVEPEKVSYAWPEGLPACGLGQLPAQITAQELLSAAQQLSAAFPDTSGYRTPEPQVRSLALEPPPLRRLPRRSLPPLGHLVPRVLHFGAAACMLGESCPLHGSRSSAAAKAPPAHPAALPDTPVSQDASPGSAWLPSSASSSPPSSCGGTSSAAASHKRRQRRRQCHRVVSASPVSAAEAAALRVQCGELEARLLVLGVPLPPAPACAADGLSDAGSDSGSDSDAHSSERLPFSGASKRARGDGAIPGQAQLA
ncbi:hypothetical protein WJX81_007647 [Elliptochloris bilobata]|uniref:Uncharacterized protein n=1 Tax=Elliptochloris bilobata TaxID=381761 RepID=A0AAW1RNR4_9CHLO